MQEGVSLLREQLGSIEFLEERVHLFVLVGEVCLGYSRARYRRPGPGFDPAHPWFSIRIAWIGGTVESAYTIYILVVPTGARVTSGFQYHHKLFLFTQFCIVGQAFYFGCTSIYQFTYPH